MLFVQDSPCIPPGVRHISRYGIVYRTVPGSPFDKQDSWREEPPGADSGKLHDKRAKIIQDQKDEYQRDSQLDPQNWSDASNW
jgi:hypothetical protein